MLGVIFGILTDSRNSILIKEMFYVSGGAVTALLAGVLLIRKTPCHYKRIPTVSLAALVLIIVYSILRHITSFGSVNGPFTIMMLLSLSVIAFTGLLFIEKSDLKFLTGAFLISSSVLFIYAVMQWQGVNIFSWDAALTRSGRSTGSLGNPNLLGGFASAAIPLGITAILVMKKGSHFLKYTMGGLFTIFAVLAIIASGTRGSLLGLAAGCAFMALWYTKKNRISLKTSIPVLLLCLVIVAAATLPMSSRLRELDPGAEEQGTLQVRKLIWSGAFAVFSDNPVFGHGPGSFQILYPEHRNPDYSILGVSHNTLHAHCEYLEILVDLGITGLLLWGVVIFFAAGRLKGAGLIRAAAFSGLVAMLAEAMVSVHLRWPPTAWLFSFLAILFMASDTEKTDDARWRIPSGVLLLVSAVILAWGMVWHYLPASTSSRMVFMGKDVYLNRTEAAMQNAYNMAVQWQNSGDERALAATLETWSYAVAYSDSSVAYSLRGTEVYPWDLGGWYALGSAHLTRYMVMDPPVTALRNALEYSGTSTEYTAEQLHEELLRGMAAYDRLVSMAPNYAEVHNNLALGYSNLGMIDEALEELYRSYRLHGHRRNEYYQQTVSLLPLSRGSISGCQLVFHHILTGFDSQSEGRRLEAQIDDLGALISLIYASLPEERDSLETLLLAIVNEELSGEIALSVGELVSESSGEGVSSWWYSDRVGSMTSDELLDLLIKTHTQSAYAGKSFPGELPVDREFYTFPFEILANGDFSSEHFQKVMDILLYQIVIDRNIDGEWTLAQSDRFSEHVPTDVVAGMGQVREAVGGSRAALRGGEAMPWLDGSLGGVLSDTLISLQSSDSLNSRWYEMEMEETFLLLSSYWWDQQIFASSQNQYLLERAFRCRDMIRELNPDSWQGRVASITDRTFNRIIMFTDGDIPVPLELLKSDLVEGVERAAFPLSE